jgi:hypothetical protein
MVDITFDCGRHCILVAESVSKVTSTLRMRFTLVTVSCRLTGLAALLGLYAPVQAGSVQGTMFVSVTILATCEISAEQQTVASVSCPQDHPYRVSQSPAVVGQMAATSTGEQFLAGHQQVQLTRNVIANGITLLTISY